MSIFSRIVRIAAKLPIIGRAVRASFDAVRQTWGERSWLYQSLQDAWLEIDSLSRQELQRIHDALIENSCIVQKIRCLYIQFSVGPSGLICTPNASRWSGPVNTPEEKTAVEKWNHARSENWERWFRKPELNSPISGAQLTRVWAGLLFDKGEIFLNLTNDGKTPKLRTIDAHRCSTPDGMREFQGNLLCDGVEISPSGQRVAYWFKKTNLDTTLTGSFAGQDSYDRIPAAKIIHKFKVRRPGQVRGIPEGFSVFNLVRDNMELHKLEMQAAKLASDIANVETNPAGELDALFNRKSRFSFPTQNASGGAATASAWADYKVSFGSKNIALRSGDKLEQFMIARPTVATQAYWDLHYTLICMGYNVPKMLVMPYSLQGTVTRADLDISSYGFGREHFEIIAELLREVYEWQTDWAVKYDLSLDGDAPEDFCCVVIRPPRAPNVDVGYNAKAMETEVRLGVRTIPEIFAEKQQDFRQKTREIAEYLKYVKDLAEEFEIEPSDITALIVKPDLSSPDVSETAELDEKPESTEESSKA